MNIRGTLGAEAAVAAALPYTDALMRRSPIALALLFSLVLAACGGGQGAGSDTVGSEAPSAATTLAPESSPTPEASQPSDQTTTAAGSEQQLAPSGVAGPSAPNFSLALDDGSTFVLSDAAKPVYIVFWAEW